MLFRKVIILHIFQLFRVKSRKRYSNLLIILISIIFFLDTEAQLNFREGYILTNENDTVYGYVNDGGFSKNYKYCLFKETRRSKAIKYLPDEIKSYHINGEKYYLSKPVLINDSVQQMFVEVLLDSGIDLYYYPAQKDLLYFLEKEENNLLGLQNLKIVVTPITYVYGPVFKLETKEYIDTLRTIFKDCKKVQPYIGQVDYNHKSFIAITRAYIEYSKKYDKKINYQKNLRLSKSSFGFFIGGQMSQMQLLDDKIYSNIIRSYPVGIIFNIPLPIFSEKLCFQTELIYYHLTGYSGNYIKPDRTPETFIDYKSKADVISMPLILKYYFLKKRLSPSVGLGKENGLIFNSKFVYISTEPDYLGVERIYYDDFLLHYFQKGWFADAGMDYKITPKLTIFMNYRVQSNLNLIITDPNYNHYTFSRAHDLTIKYDDKYAYLYKTLQMALYLGVKF